MNKKVKYIFKIYLSLVKNQLLLLLILFKKKILNLDTFIYIIFTCILGRLFVFQTLNYKILIKKKYFYIL